MLSPLGAVVAMEQSYEYVGESEDNKKRNSDSSIELCAVVENEGSVAFSFNINLLFDLPFDSAGVYYYSKNNPQVPLS